jgi:hypothetical protein
MTLLLSAVWIPSRTGGAIRLGVLPLVEGLDVAIAALVGVVDDPRFALGPVLVGP